MDMEGVLFRRMLVKHYEDKQNEENNRMPEEVIVTREGNGYACWYQADGFYPPRVIAWAYNRGQHDIIAYAAKITLGEARAYAFEEVVNFRVPSLSALALDPIAPEPKTP